MAQGEDGPDMRDPPASERRKGERKWGWAGGACCAHEILGQSEAPRPRKREGVGDGTGAHGLAGKGSGPWNKSGKEREKEMVRRGSVGPRGKEGEARAGRAERKRSEGY
jgi:hypothetical protein